jgi:hypothetical protein
MHSVREGGRSAKAADLSRPYGGLRRLYYRAFAHHIIRRLIAQRTKAARRSTEQRHYNADEPTTTAATAATKVQQALGSTSSHEPKLRHDLDTAYSRSQQAINWCALRESNPCFRRERAMSWTARRRARRPRRRRGRGATYREDCVGRQPGTVHQCPVLGIDIHGSLGASAAPFCKSSIECLSGERTKAITPSRGGRLMVTPVFISLSQIA